MIKITVAFKPFGFELKPSIKLRDEKTEVLSRKSVKTHPRDEL